MTTADVPLSALETEDTLAVAFRESVAGMAILDGAGRLRVVNGAFCRITGWSADDLIGTEPVALVHREDRHRCEEAMAALCSGAIEVDDAVVRCARRDGSLAVLACTTTALPAGIGGRSGFLVQVIDVTEAADAHEALRRSESRYRALLAHASELTVLVDVDCRMSYVSPAAERLLGHRPEQLVGRSALELLHPDDLARAEESFRRHVAFPSVPTPTAYRVRRSDGTWRDAEVVVENLFADPDVGALVLNVRDVTERRAYEEQIAASERRLRALIGNSSDLIWLLGADGRIAYCSPAVVRLFGYEPESLLGTEPLAFVHPDDHDKVRGFRAETALRGVGPIVTCRVRHANGTWRWVESVAHDQLHDPAVGGIVVTTREVSRRLRHTAQRDAIANLSRAALRDGDVEALFARAVALVAEILDVPYATVLLTRGDGELTVARRHGPPLVEGAFTAVVDGRPLSLAGRALAERHAVIWSGEATEVSPILLPRLIAAHLRSGAAAPIGDGSEVFGVLVAYSVEKASFCEEDVTFIESIANVLAPAIARRQVEDELRRRALHDTLTGLPNRVLLRERLEAALRRLTRRPSGVALIFIDTDDFKLVNDSLGHAAGDQIVTGVAQRIGAVLRASDLVARFGGDEFVVLCEDTDVEAAGLLAARLRHALAAPIVVEGRPVAVTASLGIAVTADPETSADDLLAQADTAMYAAKKSGKDRAAIFDVAMRREVTDRLEAVSGLLRGVAGNELVLHYQPVVDAESGAPIGCEALVRWEHPTEGLLLPDRFIAHAEESGAIVALGAWVLENACRQAAEWRRRGYGGQVSINVSARQLADAGIVETVARAISRTGVEPSRVLLEVTESAVSSDVQRTARVMEELSALGVRVGMDDFGTGYSSLSNLANLPFEFVKIDRSFVASFLHDRRASALLESIAALCRRLELPAIAEGVETEPQLAQIRRLGIPYVQGFLFGRPVPPPSLPSPVASPGERVTPAG